MNAVALTDHGNLAGAFEFYIACKENDVKPIVGIEAYVVPNMAVNVKGEKRYHLVLLAQNREGYQNLLKLASRAALDGFYYTPRIDMALLQRYRSGLILLTGCISSAVYLMGHEEAEVFRMIRLFQRMFPNCCYLEIMPHNWVEQRRHNALLYDAACKFDLPLVASKDCHYLDEDDREVHDVLMKVQDREPYTMELSLGSGEQMMEEWQMHDKFLDASVIAEAVYITEEIAASVEDYNLPISQFDFPSFVLS